MKGNISRQALNVIERTVAVIPDPSLKRRDVLLVWRKLANINEMLGESIRRLRSRPELYGTYIPTVSLRIAEVMRAEEPAIIAVDHQVDAPVEQVRAIVGDESVLSSEDDNGRLDLLSHLVICTFEDGVAELWRGREGGPVSVARVNAWKVVYLLHDLALDIALFHSAPRISHIFAGSVEKKRAYSALKVQFIRETTTESFFGNLDPSLSYVCLSAAVRDGETLDLAKYIRIWREFSAFVKAELPEPWEEARNHIKAKEGAFEVFWKRIPFRGELSKRKVREAYLGLSPGNWWFITTRRRPSDLMRAESLANLFATPRWRRNLWRLVADGAEIRFGAFAEWVEFIPLEVP